MIINLFGRLADLAGQRQFDGAPDGLATGTALRDWLATSQPVLAESLAHAGTRLVVNDEIVEWETQLSATDDIAIIPVVSGG